MLHWNFIKRFNHLNPPKDIKFGRTESNEEQYMQHSQKLKQDGIKLEEYISNTILRDSLIKYTYNRFPYNVEPGIKHDLLWIKPGHSLTIQEVQKIIKENNPGICLETQCVYFKNVPKNQSIKTIEHYQIFIKQDT